MNIDHLNSVSRNNTAKVTLRLLDRMQDFPPHEQVAAVAVLHALIARELKLSPTTLHNLANNITQFDRLFKDDDDKTFDAIAAYVKGELNG